MLQALISLLDMYKLAQDSGVPRDTSIEAEFRAYHLATIMAQHGKFAESRLQFYTSLQVGFCNPGPHMNASANDPITCCSGLSAVAQSSKGRNTCS
jgi:hypothetical protein